jgi:hypothetical protein
VPIDEVLKNILGSPIKQVLVQVVQCLTNDERAIRSRPSCYPQDLRKAISDTHFVLIQSDGENAVPRPAAGPITISRRVVLCHRHFGASTSSANH